MHESEPHPREGTHGARAPARVMAWAALLMGLPPAAHAEVTIRGRTDAPQWAAGADAIPFELHNGLIHFRATLRSPSGRDTAGFLVLDTGAPALALVPKVRAFLRLDTLEVPPMSKPILRRRPLTIEMGERTRLTEIDVQSEVPDTLMGTDVLGIFGPDLLREKGMLLDYRSRRWAVLPRRLAMVQRDTSTNGAGLDLAQRARIQHSRSAFAPMLGSGAVAVPVRMHQGGRILVRAHLEDPRDAWRSPRLTLLVDTGASSCGVFADVLDQHSLRTRKWPWLRDIMVHIVLGRFTSDLTLVPRVTLTEATSPIALDRVEMVADHRHSLPDVEGELGVPVHGLLGYTFLSRFRVLLDAMQGVLWLEAVQDTTRRFRYSHPGIQLERRWGRMRVAAVARDSPADRAGIVVGDIVISIAGTNLATVAPERAEEWLRGPAGSEVVVVVRREGAERVLRLKREQLL